MITATEADSQRVEIDRNGNESVTPEIVKELHSIFCNVPGMEEADRVALASLLLKLTGRAKKTKGVLYG